MPVSTAAENGAGSGFELATVHPKASPSGSVTARVCTNVPAAVFWEIDFVTSGPQSGASF